MLATGEGPVALSQRCDGAPVGVCGSSMLTVRRLTHVPHPHAGAGLGVLLSRRALEAESAKIIAQVPAAPLASPGRSRPTLATRSPTQLSCLC